MTDKEVKEELESKTYLVEYVDGLYAEIFAVKDGVRYDSHIVNIDDASKMLIDCLVDGIQNIIMGEVEESNIDYD